MKVIILWFIGFCGTLHWSLSWRGLGFILSALAFSTLSISISKPWCSPSKISTHHWVGPRKSVSNWAQHVITLALTVTNHQYQKITCHCFGGKILGAKVRISGNFERSDCLGFTPKPLQIPNFGVHHWKEREKYNQNKSKFSKIFCQHFDKFLSFHQYFRI